MRESGLSQQDEAFAKATMFLQRTQNLRAVNDFKGSGRDESDKGAWYDVTSGDDGGAAYYPGNSPAGCDTLKDTGYRVRATGVLRARGNVVTYFFCAIRCL